MKRKQTNVAELTMDELQERKADLNRRRGEVVSRIKDLKAAIAEPDLDPTQDFSAAVAAIAETDQELRAAQAMLPVIEKQLAAVGNAMEAHREAERKAKAESMRPAEDAAKKRLVSAFLEFVAALEEAHDLGQELRKYGHTTLPDLERREIRMQLRAYARTLGIFALPYGEGLNENAVRAW